MGLNYRGGRNNPQGVVYRAHILHTHSPTHMYIRGIDNAYTFDTSMSSLSRSRRYHRLYHIANLYRLCLKEPRPRTIAYPIAISTPQRDSYAPKEIARAQKIARGRESLAPRALPTPTPICYRRLPIEETPYVGTPECRRLPTISISSGDSLGERARPGDSPHMPRYTQEGGGGPPSHCTMVALTHRLRHHETSSNKSFAGG
jgi:hypothetical protein